MSSEANSTIATRDESTTPPTSATRERSVTYQPAADITEFGDRFELTADLPGSTADGISIDVENSVLTLTARVTPRQSSETRYDSRGYGQGDFHRQFRLGETIDVDRIEATYTDGVLRLTLPKRDSAQPRRIAVRTTPSAR